MFEGMKSKGLPAEKLKDTTRIVEQISREVMFTPGSQPKLTIRVDELSLLLQAARDGLVAHALYEALIPATAELTETGAIATIPEVTQAMSQYQRIHPEISNSEAMD